MAALTARQLAWLRAQLGDTPPDAELQAAFDRLGSVRDVAIETIRKRYQVLIDQPASTSLAGVGSMSWGENIKALERMIASLSKLDSDPSDDTEPPLPDDGSRRGAVIYRTRARGR